MKGEIIMNSVLLIGRLVKDPDLRYTQGEGKAVCHFTLAVNRMSKDDKADFFRVVAWGKTAENCANYLSKGSQVAIQGRLQNNNYENKNGEKVYSDEVWANQVKFLGGGKNDNSNNSDTDGFQPIDDDEDIPF